MIEVSRSCIFILLCGALISTNQGCVTVDPSADFEQARERLSEAVGQDVLYSPDQEEEIEQRVELLLADGLTLDEAVQIALLNNPTLQAACLEIGMARADRVQAGLLSNPSLGLMLRFPAGGGLANLEAGIAQNLADLWQIPARKRVGQAALDRAILDVAWRAAELVAEVKTAYYQAVGNAEVHSISTENLNLTRQLLDMTTARQRAGAGNALDVNLSRGLTVEAELSLESSRLAAAESRRELIRSLGLAKMEAELTLTDPLPTVPARGLDSAVLVTTALTHRLDLQTADRLVAVAQAELDREYASVFSEVSVGLSLERGERTPSEDQNLLAETARASLAQGALTAPEIEPRSRRDVDTDFIIGPSLNLELPIFDQNQAGIARAHYAYLQAEKTREALRREVLVTVQSVVDQAATAWRLALLYRDQNMPLAQTNLELSRESYRAGQTPFLSVLESQRFLLTSRTKQMESWTQAAGTIAALERAIGIPFDRIDEVLSATAETVPPPIVTEAVEPVQGEGP